MTRASQTLLAIMSILLFAYAAAAAIPGLDDFGSSSTAQPVTARAVLDKTLLLPGESARIAVEITVDPRYHIQSGFAIKPNVAAKVSPKPSEGLTFGDVQYQKGKDIVSPPALGTGMLTVYEGKAYILVPVTAATDTPPGERTVTLSLTTQACDDKSCLAPKTVPLKVTLTIGKSGDTAAPANATVFDAAAKEQFAPGPPPATESARGLPETTAPPTTAAPSGAGRDVPLLSITDQQALINARPYAPRNSDEDQHSLPAIFLFALVGGLILNVMPCVLPVIPLKALSFVQQAHGNARLAMLHALTFSAGVVSLFVGLGAALRIFGLFYGQQFQSPAFLVAMVCFVVALSLSMLGVWTINPPQAVYNADVKFAQHSGFAGTFGSGIMATLLATPCSAPFLGPVFAWALQQPAWLTAAMLGIVGVGMSLPYLLLAAFPKLLNRVPRAGRWSELLKQGLGIVMLGVAIYLVTLVPDTQLWPWVLVGTVVVALTCWGWGQIPSPLMDRPRLWTIRTIVLAVGLLLGLGVYNLATRFTHTRVAANPSGTVFLANKADGQWLPFNVALLDEALKQGRPVVVDWTADWCINCRVLEATVLDRAETRQAFLAHNAVLLRADLSEDNPPASDFNKKLGGEAIPVLAIFSPSQPEKPVVLRDKYSVARVTQELGTP